MASALVGASLPAYARDPSATVHIENADITHRISPGDTLNINVSPAVEYSREVIVQPDGTIDMPMIEQVNTKSLTTTQLGDLLIQKLSKFVSKPQVTVSIRIFASRIVTIAGEINSSGTYEYKDGMRLLDLLMKCGGPRDNARLSKIKVFRKEGGKVRRFNVDFERFIYGDFTDNIELQPSDMVYVPTFSLVKGARWLNDNLVPWFTLIILGTSVAILARNR